MKQLFEEAQRTHSQQKHGTNCSFSVSIPYFAVIGWNDKARKCCCVLHTHCPRTGHSIKSLRTAGTWLWFCHLSKRNNFELHVKRANNRHKCSMCVCVCASVREEGGEEARERTILRERTRHTRVYIAHTNTLLIGSFAISHMKYTKILSRKFSAFESSSNYTYRVRST